MRPWWTLGNLLRPTGEGSASVAPTFYETPCHASPEKNTVMYSIHYFVQTQSLQATLQALWYSYRALGEYKPSVSTGFWKGGGMVSDEPHLYKKHNGSGINAPSCARHSRRLSRQTWQRSSLIRAMSAMAHSNSTRDNWRTSCHVGEWYIPPPSPPPDSHSLSGCNHPLSNWCSTSPLPQTPCKSSVIDGQKWWNAKRCR